MNLPMKVGELTNICKLTLDHPEISRRFRLNVGDISHRVANERHGGGKSKSLLCLFPILEPSAYRRIINLYPNESCESGNFERRDDTCDRCAQWWVNKSEGPYGRAAVATRAWHGIASDTAFVKLSSDEKRGHVGTRRYGCPATVYF
jgi:hypothetical protein